MSEKESSTGGPIVVVSVLTLIFLFMLTMRLFELHRRVSSLESRITTPITAAPPSTVATSAPAPPLSQDFDIMVENNGEPVSVSSLTGAGTVQCAILADVDVTSCRIHAPFETRRVGATLETQIFRFQVRRGNAEATIRSGRRCYENPAIGIVRGFRTGDGFSFYARPTTDFMDGSDPGDCNLVVRYDQVESADPNHARDAYLAERRRDIDMDRRTRELEQRLQQRGIAPSVRPTSL